MLWIAISFTLWLVPDPLKVSSSSEHCHKQGSYVDWTEFQMEVQCVILLVLTFV